MGVKLWTGLGRVDGGWVAAIRPASSSIGCWALDCGCYYSSVITSDTVATYQRDGVILLTEMFDERWIDLLKKGLVAIARILSK